MMEKGHKRLSIRRQCVLLGIHRSGVYYQPSPVQYDTELANALYELWEEMPYYGYRRLTAALRRQGYDVNSKRVRRVMGEMGIEALYPKPRTTQKSAENPVYPYLLRGLAITAPDTVWATDITYIRLPGGFVYLVALIDVYSRYIVAWRLSNTMDTAFCLEMLAEGFARGKPLILNTDQGSQFTCQAWVEAVEQAGVRVSQDGKGRWVDNVTIERFWRTLKHEHLRFVLPETIGELRREISGFIRTYNDKRLHQSLGYQTPAELYYRHNAPPHGYVDNPPPGGYSLPTYPQGHQQPKMLII